MSESPSSIVPHDWIPLVYADRHGNLKLSQAALEIARQLSLPGEQDRSREALEAIAKWNENPTLSPGLPTELERMVTAALSQES